MGSSVDQGCTGRTLLAAEQGGAKKRVNSQNMIWIIWIIPCNCLSNFNGLKSTLPRCAPQVLVIFTGWDNWQSLLLLLLLRGTRAPPAANGSQPKMALRGTLVPKNHLSQLPHSSLLDSDHHIDSIHNDSRQLEWGRRASLQLVWSFFPTKIF